MALVTLPKDQRSIAEQQAARKLQEDLGREPTQTEIYQQAYNTAYPVFAEDFGTPELKKKVDLYTKNLYNAAGNIRKGVIDPQANQRYRSGLEQVFSADKYDPLTRQRIIQGILGQRKNATNSQFAQRYGAYQTQRGQALFDYQNAFAQQNANVQAASDAEQADMEYQRQLARDQQQFQYSAALKNMRAPSTRTTQKSTVDENQVNNIAGLILDNYYTALENDPAAQMDTSILSGFSSDMKSAVLSKIAEYVGNQDSGQVDALPTDQEQEIPITRATGEVFSNIGNTLSNTVGRGFGNVTSNIGSNLRSGVESLIDLFR